MRKTVTITTLVTSTAAFARAVFATANSFLRKNRLCYLPFNILGVRRAACMLFCAIATYAPAVEAQAEALSATDVFPAGICLFDNASFKYRSEVNDEGRWKLRSKTEVFWDVRNQRAKVTVAERPYSGMPADWEKPMRVSWKVAKGVSLLIRKPADLDKNLNDIKGERNASPATAVINNDSIIGGRVRTIMDMYYERDSIPLRQGALFKQTADSISSILFFYDLDPNNILVAKGKTVFLLDKKDKTINGIIRYYEPILKKEDLKRDFHLKMTVSKKKMIDGVLFPLEIDQILVMTYRDKGESKKKKFVERIIVDEKSVRINRGINESDLQLRIPAGSNVINALANTMYVADGVSDDIYEEKPVTALEQAVGEAIKNKEAEK